jgi:hypothetical protein
LTTSEAKQLSWKESTFWGSFAYMMISPFYGIYMFKYIKKFPQYRDAGLRRIFIMPLLAAGMVSYSGGNMQRYTKEMIDKYIRHLSDQEIINFEANYQAMMMKRQQAVMLGTNPHNLMAVGQEFY